MNAVEALTVTMLGLAATFLGLSLTSLLIVALSALSTGRAPRPAKPVAPPVAAAVSPDIVGVIATVLEAERRLYHTAGLPRTAGRVTARGEAGRGEHL